MQKPDSSETVKIPVHKNYLVDKDRIFELLLRLFSKGMPTTQTAFEVVEAYADVCHANHAHLERSLTFKATIAVSGEELYRIMRAVVPRYNDFTAEATSHLMFTLPRHVQYRIAREGSVCLYVEYLNNFPEQELKTIAEFISVTEYSLQPDGLLRLWWD